MYRALHEKEEQRMSRAKFFTIALICSFTWYTIPSYLFPTITNISWLCWFFSDSVTAQQIGSGIHAWARPRCHHPRLGCRRLFPLQPAHLPFLRHRQHLRRLSTPHVRCHSGRLLRIQLIQRPRRSPSSPLTCSRRLGNHITLTSPPSSTTGLRSTWQLMNSKEGSTSVCSSLSAMALASLRLLPRSHMCAFSMEGTNEELIKDSTILVRLNSLSFR